MKYYHFSKRMNWGWKRELRLIERMDWGWKRGCQMDDCIARIEVSNVWNKEWREYAKKIMGFLVPRGVHKARKQCFHD